MLIAGGGLAGGSAVAIQLGRLGVSVELFECGRFPKKNWGEGLMASGVATFERLGLFLLPFSIIASLNAGNNLPSLESRAIEIWFLQSDAWQSKMSHRSSGTSRETAVRLAAEKLRGTAQAPL